MLAPISRYRLGDWLFDLNACSLGRGAEVRTLSYRATRVLDCLIRAQGEPVRRQALIEHAWPDTIPTDDSLSQAISELRRALDDNSRDAHIVITIPRVGYRVPVELLQPLQPEVHAQPPEPAAPRGTRRRPGAFVLGSGLALTALAITIAWALRTDVQSAPVAANDALARALGDAQQLTSDRGWEMYADVSADGTRVAYSAQSIGQTGSDLFVRLLGAPQPTRLTDTPEISEYLPVWSEDGTRIAFLFYSIRQPWPRLGVIYADGSGRRQYDLQLSASRAYWEKDGNGIILAAHVDGIEGSSLYRLDVGTGELLPLAYDHDVRQVMDIDPRIAPDGLTLAFRRGINPRTRLMLKRPGDATPIALTPSEGGIFGYDWMPDGRALLVAGEFDARSGLWLVSVDGSRELLRRDSAIRYPSVASTARVITFERWRSNPELVELALDPKAAVQRRTLFPSTAAEFDARYSPDGRQLVFVSTRGGEPQLWLGSLDSGEAEPLTSDLDAVPSQPQWRADGAAIAFLAESASGSVLMEIDLTTRGVRSLSPPDVRVRSGGYNLASDGIVFVARASGGEGWALYSRSPFDGPAIEQVRADALRPVEVAPGEFVFYRSNRTGLWRWKEGMDHPESGLGSITWRNQMSWEIRPDGVWYLQPYDSAGEMGLEVRRAASATLDGAGEMMLKLPLDPAYMTLALSPDGARLVVSESTDSDSDLQLVRY